MLGTGYDLEKGFRLRRALQFGLTLAFGDPEDGVVGVAIDGLVVQTLIPTKGKGMDNGEKLADIISAMHRTIVKHLIARLQIDGLLFHRPRIATTGSIHGPSIGPHLHRQWKHGVGAIIWRILGNHL